MAASRLNKCMLREPWIFEEFSYLFSTKSFDSCKVSVWNALNRTPVGFRYYQIIANIGKVNIGICKIKCAE